MITVLEYILLAALIAADLLISRWLGLQAYSWMPAEATQEAQRVDDLFSLLVAVGAFIFLGIVGVIAYALLFFRVASTDYTEGHPGRGNWKVEVLWTAVPTLLVLWIAFQSANIYGQLNILGLTPIVDRLNPLESPAYAQEPEPNPAAGELALPKPAEQSIGVVAKQWEWSFRYPNGVTTSELHLPLNTTTQLRLSSKDVIHGFYMPAFRAKQDIFPDRDITFAVTPTQLGEYRLQDSQFSGEYFALMLAPVVVEAEADYRQWLEKIAHNPPDLPQMVAEEQAHPPRRLFNSGWTSGDEIAAAEEEAIALQDQVTIADEPMPDH